ncbi:MULTISPECIES: hypothetical protein [unclassified Pseudomonas]|uniref:hypothetical protein n=1 Tax=unclassified Pseudomonas TaxID=196821 RepID=UPI002B228477|nr:MULTISPECIES: hypothetical protein [unclassified Pseudomonas]MEB0008178.1 hypothetical protein [Pseudomonas sp. RTB2]MEB0015900.1 hypothetical protein [Pseudomonas sp. RTB3]MEB0270886.1 hypothetical protein [Pseudomonas sp. 5B4]MEE3507793.1 hypothetical protein [Pseudomonas sp. 10C3]
MKKKSSPEHHLQLRVRELGQLFNSMDPTPFLNKDLDREAEAFIETWAAEFTSDSRLKITIHLEHLPAEGEPSAIMVEAIHNYFDHKAGLVRGELKHLLRDGRISLLIGVSFVILCLIMADVIGKLGTGPVINIARESLMIVGWVAMWRPLQIFLYDWWPLLRLIRVYKSISHARVQVVQGK